MRPHTLFGTSAAPRGAFVARGLLAAGLWCARAEAQQAPPERCVEALQSARSASAAQRWTEVLAALEPLREQCDSAQFQYAYARTLHGLGRLREAHRAYQRTLELGGAQLSAELAADIAARDREAQGSLVHLSVEVAPAGATVLLDGVEVAAGAETELEPGEHRVTVQLARYRRAQQTLQLERGERRRLRVELEREGPPLGRLRVLSNVAEAALTLDGRVLGRGVAEAEVPPGAHVVRVTARGYQPFEARVEVVVDELRERRVALVPVPPWYASPWPWLGVGVGVAGVGLGLGLGLGLRPYTGSFGRVLEVRP